MNFRQLFILFGMILISNPDNAQVFRYVVGFGNNPSNQPWSICTDNEGNTYVMGQFKDSVSYRGEAFKLHSDTLYSTYLMKFNCAHQLVWKNKLGSNAQIASGIWDPAEIKYDQAGNLYITGQMGDSSFFTSTSGISSVLIRTNNKSTDIFICSYDTSGALRWHLNCGGPGADVGRSLAIDHSGNILIGGLFTGTATFQSTSGPFVTKANPLNNYTTAGFVAKYTSNGQLIWVSSSLNAYPVFFNSLDIDQNDNIYAAIYSNGTSPIQLGQITLNRSSGNWGVFIAKLNSNGNWIWVNGTSSNYYCNVNSVTVDDSGRVYVGLEYQIINLVYYSATGGTNVVLGNNGTLEGGVVAMDTAGSVIWGKSFGGAAADHVYRVTTAEDGTLIVLGSYQSSVNFGNGFLRNNGNPTSNGYLLTIDQSSSNVIGLADAVGYGGGYEFNAIATDRPGEIYLCGTMYDSVSIADTVLYSSPAQANTFYAKLIPVRSFPLKAMPSDTVCHGEPMYLTPRRWIYDGVFQWYKNDTLLVGATNDTLNIRSSGTYKVVFTNLCNHSDTSVPKYVIYDSLYVRAGSDTTICFGDSIQLNATTTPHFRWRSKLYLSDSLVNSPWCKPLDTARFVLRGLTPACNAFDTVQVNVNHILLKADSSQNICFGDSVVLNVTGANSYLWTPSLYLNNSNSNQVISKPLDSVRYSIRGFRGSCRTDTTVHLSVIKINLKTGTDTTICRGDSIHLLASGAFNYSWFPSKGLSDSISANPWCAAQDSIRYFITGSTAQCKAVSTFMVNVNSIVVNAGSNNSICPKDSVQLIGSGSGLLGWFPAAGLKDTSLQQPYVHPPSTVTYILQARKGFCTSKDSVTVIVKPVILIQTSPDTSVCGGATFHLRVSGANQYFWSPPDHISNVSDSVPLVNPIASIDYIVVASGNGCPATDTIHIDVKPLPVVNAGSDFIACNNEEYALNPVVSNGDTYQWTPVDGLINPIILNPILHAAKSNDYILFVTNGQTKCINSDTIHISVDSVLSKFTAAPLFGIVPLNVQFTDHSLRAITNQWTFDSLGATSQDPSPAYLYKIPGVYHPQLIVINSNGCRDTFTTIIHIEYVPSIRIPNVFTPNEDGLNDFFQPEIKNPSFYKNIHVTIRDRWGDFVEELNWPQDQWWNGKSNGNECSPGTYFYVMEITDVLGKKSALKGTVTLLR